MKKILLVAVLAFMASASVQAQDFKKGFTFAPKVGVNIANLSISGIKGATIDSKDAKIGFNIGVYGQYRFTKVVALEAGLSYSMEGASKIKASTNDDETEIKETLGYLNIPITAKFYVAQGLNLFVGPQIGLKVNDKSEVDGEEGSLTDPKTLVVSGIAGIGYDFKCGLLIQANYNFGLSNVADGLDGANLKSNVAQVMVGWRF